MQNRVVLVSGRSGIVSSVDFQKALARSLARHVTSSSWAQAGRGSFAECTDISIIAHVREHRPPTAIMLGCIYGRLM